MMDSYNKGWNYCPKHRLQMTLHLTKNTIYKTYQGNITIYKKHTSSQADNFGLFTTSM